MQTAAWPCGSLRLWAPGTVFVCLSKMVAAFLLMHREASLGKPKPTPWQPSSVVFGLMPKPLLLLLLLLMSSIVMRVKGLTTKHQGQMQHWASATDAVQSAQTFQAQSCLTNVNVNGNGSLLFLRKSSLDSRLNLGKDCLHHHTGRWWSCCCCCCWWCI